LASALLSAGRMNARAHLPSSLRHPLEALLVEGRMPLDAAVQLARALVQTLADHHEAQRAVGPFDASSTTIDSLGHVRLSASVNPAAAAPELAAGADADLLSDLYSLGAVFYRLFSGLTPADAQRRAGGHLPPPSRFNPTVDDALDGLVLTLLDPDPMQRPYRLAQVEGQLVALGAELGVEAGTNVLVSWLGTHRPAAPTPRVPSMPIKRPAAVRWQLEADDDELDESAAGDEAWEGAVRFDVWAAASAGVVALGIMLIALM
jgi:hypothetical protein